MKTEDGESYGPVDRDELDDWVAEGRLNRDCQLLRKDDEQWQWADAIYPDLADDGVDATVGGGEPSADDERPSDSPREPATKLMAATRDTKSSSAGIKPTERAVASVERQDDDQISDRSRITAGLLGIFLGPLGLHRIYLGYVTIGLLMLATGGGCGIWSMIDAIRVLLGKVPDASGRALRI